MARPLIMDAHHCCKPGEWIPNFTLTVSHQETLQPMRTFVHIHFCTHSYVHVYENSIFSDSSFLVQSVLITQIQDYLPSWKETQVIDSEYRKQFNI